MFRLQRQHKITAEQTAHNAKVKAAREAAAMTCQCCGGKFLANLGTVAHHGYTRPGDGWQSASCYGAKHLPFEVDRATLGDLIVAITARIKHMRAGRRAVAAEECAISREFTDYTQPRVPGAIKRPTITLEYTRENFDALNTEHAEVLRRYCGQAHSFDELKKHELAERDQHIKNTKDDLTRQQARYDGWTVTHEWVPGPAGVKLMPTLSVEKGALGGWRKVSTKASEGLTRLANEIAASEAAA